MYVLTTLLDYRSWLHSVLDCRELHQTDRAVKWVPTILPLEFANPSPGVFQIGFAYGAGIMFAIAVCAATSGGHFSPGVTIVLTLFKGFPKTKAVRYERIKLFKSYQKFITFQLYTSTNPWRLPRMLPCLLSMETSNWSHGSNFAPFRKGGLRPDHVHT